MLPQKIWRPENACVFEASGRAVARALIGGGGRGGIHIIIRVMPDGFLLKSVVFKLISKEISRAEHEYMNIHPPINALATTLCRAFSFSSAQEVF